MAPMTNYDMPLNDIVKKIKALDNKTKLEILMLLIKEGSKSITDISKELRINFSTAHKYLEQLENADIVKSKQVVKDRVKRVFFVKDFSIDLSPRSINDFNQSKPKQETGFNIITESGKLEFFDTKKFSKTYVEKGIPSDIIEDGLEYIDKRAYDGITILELKELFSDFIANRITILKDAVRTISEGLIQEKTYSKILLLYHNNYLESHMNGDLFITNLSKPKLLNFMHDLRGISIHGINGSTAKNISEYLNQVEQVINSTSKISYSTQAFDSFNYFVAPIASKNTTQDIKKALNTFIKNLEKTNTTFYIGLDLGIPKFFNEITPIYEEEYIKEKGTVKKYEDYQIDSIALTKLFLDILNKEKPQNITPVFKVWDKKFDSSILPSKNYFIANMLPDWQTKNASYVGNLNRFDYLWKRWMRTVRVGEVQNIVLNLPRLTAKAKNEKNFFELLDKKLDYILDCHFDIAEFAIGSFMRKNETNFESIQNRKWSYAQIDDSTYSISILGLNECIKILTDNKMQEDIGFAEKILKFCNNKIKTFSDAAIRIVLKEEQNPLIARRFYTIDSDKKINVKSYTSGILCDDMAASASLHKYLNGGHCIYSKKLNLKELFKTNFGLAYIGQNSSIS